MSYKMIDGKKTWVADPNTVAWGFASIVASKKKYVEKAYPLWEVYSKSDLGLTKYGEVRGPRAEQVRLRREARSKLNIGGERVILFCNGQLVKVGIDKGA